MFLANLSTTVLLLCNEMNFSYEFASELCDLSPRYFGDIARGKTAPTILTLEKLCTGFDRTPNDLLIPASQLQKLDPQQQMPVTQIRYYEGFNGRIYFPLSPV